MSSDVNVIVNQFQQSASMNTRTIGLASNNPFHHSVTFYLVHTLIWFIAYSIIIQKEYSRRFIYIANRDSSKAKTHAGCTSVFLIPRPNDGSKLVSDPLIG